jgi:two-component sensor histidine kinase
MLDDPTNQRIIVGTDLGIATVHYGSFEVNWLALKSLHTNLKKSYYSYLYQDLEGNIWSLISGQLYVLDLDKNIASPFKEISDVESVKWLVEQPKGQLWLNTNEGIIRYFKESKHATIFENKNFSEGSQKYPSAVTVMNDKIYFGGTKGVSIIDPSTLEINNIAPNLFITKFSYPFTNAKGTIKDTSIFIDSQKRIELSYYQNDLLFSYTGLEYKDPKLNKYKFYLDGYDQDWIEVDDQRNAVYTNISPGTNTFMVKAANSDGVWTKGPATFTVIINPPWWQTWWAYLIYAGLIALCIYSWIRYQVFRKTIQLKNNERLRTKISADLHDEVGSILSGLAMKSELMSYTANEKEQEELSQISEMSKDAMERMRDTVWAIDSRKDNYENLIDRMKEFSEKNLSLKQIDYKFITENLDLSAFISPEKRQNTYLIFKEAITNILKHSDARNVVVRIATNNNQFLLNLKDDGNLQNGYESTGQGTSNMKMRAENMGGNLEMSYEDGFQINLVYPLN